MYCPECGNDAGDAKFCPECGANLSGVKDVLRGKTTGEQSGKTTGQQGRKSAADRPPRDGAAAAAASRARGLSPAVIWGGFGAIAVIVIIVVVMISGGFGGSNNNTSTTGDYQTLVKRANDLYDKGDSQFKNQDFQGGSATFKEAAAIYAAALAKQAGDPAVSTDYATSLFYSGNIDAAVAMAKKITTQDPTFQPAWFNLGNFYAHKARIMAQTGSKAKAAPTYALARAAYTKAVALDPTSATGKQADASLQGLPK
jgi:tetratricopeptide (TPR) repeat protein